MISITHLLNDMMQSVIPAVYPLLKEKFGFTFAQIGIITLVFQMTSSLLQPFIGLYADRHPRPYSLATGMCFTLLGLFALSVAPGFVPILLAVGLIGCGSSVFHPESSRVAQLASGGRKGLAQSIFQVGGNAGGAMGPLLAALVVIPFGQASIGWFALAATPRHPHPPRESGGGINFASPSPQTAARGSRSGPGTPTWGNAKSAVALRHPGRTGILEILSTSPA